MAKKKNKDSIDVDPIDISSYTRKKKKKTDDELLQQAYEHEDVDSDILDDEDDWEPDDIDELDRGFDDGEGVSNSLQLAQLTTKASEVARQFKEIPKEVKLAFLEEKEKLEIKHSQRNYRNFNYIKKTLRLQKLEDDVMVKNRMAIYKVKNKDELKKYFQNNNLEFVYNMYSDDEIAEILGYLPELKSNGFNEDMKRSSDTIVKIYAEYRKNNAQESYVDDSGHLGDILSTAVDSSGFQGNERMQISTSISATKDIETQQQVREKAKQDRNVLGRFVKRFT